MAAWVEHMDEIGESNREVVSVLLVEDHEMVAEALVNIIDAEPDLRVVRSVGTATAAMELSERLNPDVIVMDQRLPDGLGSETASHILDSRPDQMVILLTGGDVRASAQAALDAGCVGFVSKDQAAVRLIEAIRAAVAGAAVFPAEMLTSYRTVNTGRASIGSDLTERELEVLSLLASGHTTEEIAAEVIISVHTVRNHVRHVLSKLGSKSKLEAVVVAAGAGIVVVGPPQQE